MSKIGRRTADKSSNIRSSSSDVIRAVPKEGSMAGYNYVQEVATVAREDQLAYVERKLGAANTFSEG